VAASISVAGTAAVAVETMADMLVESPACLAAGISVVAAANIRITRNRTDRARPGPDAFIKKLRFFREFFICFSSTRICSTSR
jgi:hypothetical protein